MQAEAGFAAAGEVAEEGGGGVGTGVEADGADLGLDNRAEVGNGAFADDDVGGAIAEFQPKEAVAGEGGESGEAAAEGCAEVVVIWLKGRGDDKRLGGAAGEADTHGFGERDLGMEVLLEILEELGVAVHFSIGIA